MTREKRPPSERTKGLRARILGLLTERALNKVEISKSLNLPAQQRGKLRELLREMEVGGEVARIRKDRYVIPADADLLTGAIQFHASGSAHVLGENAFFAGEFVIGVTGL